MRPPTPRQRAILIVVVGAVLGALGVWGTWTDQKAPGAPPAGEVRNWLTQLWKADNPQQASPSSRRNQPAVPRGPVAPDLFLRASFPSPDDPSQAYASISEEREDAAPKLYRMGDTVAGEYTLAEVGIRYAGLDRDGKRFYLYRALPADRQLSPEREARRQQREQMRAQRRLVREKRLAAKLAAAEKRGPIELPDGTVYVPVLGGPDRIEDGRGNLIRHADEPPEAATSP